MNQRKSVKIEKRRMKNEMRLNVSGPINIATYCSLLREMLFLEIFLSKIKFWIEGQLSADLCTFFFKREEIKENNNLAH